MTIREIESIIEDLRLRHKDLDEELLITLLTAGGWENKTIKDAVALFRLAENKIIARKTPPEKTSEEKPVVIIEEEVIIVEQEEIPREVFVIEKRDEEVSLSAEEMVPTKRKMVRGRLERQEKEILFLTGAMLFAVIFLLFYMSFHDKVALVN